MRREFTSAIDQDTGELGWKDSRIKCGAYGSIAYGPGLAHDCIEHFAFDDISSEIEAHGAMYRIRYQSGWTSEYGRGMEIRDFASEWQNLLSGLVNEGGYLPQAKKTRPLGLEIESDIDRIIQQGKQFCIHNEVAECQREDADSRLDLPVLAERFRDHFRNGYRKAGRRYRGHQMHDIAHLMGTLAKSFERHKPEMEGQRIVVHIDMRMYQVRIEEKYDA